MIIINTHKKKRYFAVALILIISLGINVFSYLQNRQLSANYQSLLCMTQQFDAANLFTFVMAKKAVIQENTVIEIFDISKGKVVKTIQSNSTIKNESIHILNGITGPYEKIEGFPDEGYIIKVPFQPSIPVNNRWLNTFDIKSIDEVFILFPKGHKPYLLVLDERDRPIFFNFEGDTSGLFALLT